MKCIVDSIHRFIETDYLETRSKWALGVAMVLLTSLFIVFAAGATPFFLSGDSTTGLSLFAFGLSCLAFAVTIASHTDSTIAAGESQQNIEMSLRHISEELAGIRADLDTSLDAKAVWCMTEDINRLNRKTNWSIAISLLPFLRRK